MLIAITTRFEKRLINTGFQTFFRDVIRNFELLCIFSP